ncbi:hypothetical protein [Megalodesulfovibrio paquesii]
MTVIRSAGLQCFLLVLFASFSSFASFANSALAADPAVTPLTAADVQGFIASMHELRPIFAAAGGADPADKTRNAPDAPAPEGPIDASQWLTLAATQPKALAVLQKHGFTAERWGAVAEQIMQAYTSLKLGPEGANARAQIQSSLTQLEQQPGLSAEDKQLIRQQMQESLRQMDQMAEESSKADQETVRPFLSKLDAVFEVE